MKELIGKMTASLAREEQSGDDLMAVLNANIKPPEPIEESAVYIRAMYIVSDQVNSYGGRFPAEDHDHLARLLVDSPVLVGHRKDSLPIARNFHAEKVVRDGANWIKVYFYWLKTAEGGENLRKNIDAGIYKEGSISFVFSLPECTICGRDIRNCPHQPFVRYKTPTGQVKAAFNYRKIERVLETSLVYRGSVQNTSIEKALVFDPNQKKQPSKVEAPRRYIIWNHEKLDSQKEYLVFPAYESIPVLVEVRNQRVAVRTYAGREINSTGLAQYLEQLTWPEGEYVLDGRLIGYRGKERQLLSELSKYLRDETSVVTRIELKLYDIISNDDISYEHATGGERRAALTALFDKCDGLLPKSAVYSGDNLTAAIAEVSTRFGCEMFAVDGHERFLLTHHKIIAGRTRTTSGGKNYQCSFDCTIEEQKKQILADLKSSHAHDSESMIFIEVNGIHEVDGCLTAMHPKVVDRSEFHDLCDDLSLVLSSPCVKPKTQEYLVYKSGDDAILQFQIGDEVRSLRIRNFVLDGLNSGRRFLAVSQTIRQEAKTEILGKGRVIEAACSGNCNDLELDGSFKGVFCLRPAKINGQKCFTFSRRMKHV